MTDPVAQRAELQRLERELGVAPGELEDLAQAPACDLHALREAIADDLLERQRDGFERVVALARCLPATLAAKLAQHALGPALAARATTLIDADQAASLAQRMPPTFLADVAEHLDARRIGPLLSRLPVSTLTATAAELGRRKQWIVLGAFVGHLRLGLVRPLLRTFDGEAILRSGVFVDRTERIDVIARVLPDGRLDELLQAAHRHALWPEAMWLLARLSRAQATRVVVALERLQVDALDSLAELLLVDADLRAAVGPFIKRAPAELRRRIAA